MNKTILGVLTGFVVFCLFTLFFGLVGFAAKKYQRAEARCSFEERRQTCSMWKSAEVKMMTPTGEVKVVCMFRCTQPKLKKTLTMAGF